MNLFRENSIEKRIIKNEEVFNADYMPEDILCRSREIKEIVANLKGIEEKRRPPGIFIHGPPGTGKTTSTRYILRDLSEYTKRAVTIFLNCWSTPTRYSIVSRIAEELKVFLPSSGLQIEEIFNRIKKACENEGLIPLIVLDEADVLVKHREENQALLYDLLRMREVLGVNAGVVFITNDPSFVQNLDKRIKSSLVQVAVEFKPYGPAELKEILRERAKAGFFAGTWDDEVIGMCAAFGAKNEGDARISINTLWLAARDAEAKNQEKVMISNVQSIRDKVSVITREKLDAEKIDETERQVLEAIGKEEITSGDLYKKLDLNERTVRNYLARLEQLGLIELKMASLEKGRTKIIKRRF